jgi:acyl transferase domain-containing protein/NADPH:quinone reductase-like Zn-dependent oxidoreductase
MTGAHDTLKRTFLALKKARQELDALREPIAVVGMGCRLPGGGDNPEKFWELLRTGTDTTSRVPAERWDAGRYHDPELKAPGRSITDRGAFLTCPIDTFDAPFFNISGKESRSLDPQQRLLLEVGWEAFEDACMDTEALKGSRTGVYIGIGNIDYVEAHRCSGDPSRIDPYSLTGSCLATAGGRLSYFFGFEGPAVSVDTACSSSLVALHLACQGLRMKETDLALVGGVSLMLTPNIHICSSSLGTISPDGRSKTFDASANGYGRGEGCGMVVLKRLGEALADGDRIRCVVRSTAVNQDGKSTGLTAPNGQAQVKLIREALSLSGLTPADIGYVECHGTGTSLGDPIELEAICQVLGEGHSAGNPLYAGSVKTNIGHLESAAGISGLIKLILSLENRMIPPHLHLKNPNPHIPWGEIPVKIPLSPTPWSGKSAPLRGGIGSFGFSGTNAYAIIEAAPQAEARNRNLPESAGENRLHILPVSARSREALRELCEHDARHLEKDCDPVAHLCRTAGAGRRHFEHRAAVVGVSAAELAEELRKLSDRSDPSDRSDLSVPTDRSDRSDQATPAPRIAFLFTGQGSQYPGMGSGLLETEPRFREAFEACDAILEPLLGRSLKSLLYSGEEKGIHLTRYTQPCIFAIEYALYRLWESWGIRPALMAGHSIGEFVAACAAGVFDLQGALTLVCKRAELMGALPAVGGMAAIMAPEERIAGRLAGLRADLSLAAVNGPDSIVVSGRLGALEALLADLKREGIAATKLVVSHAFHSPLMEPILSKFHDAAAKIRYSPPERAIISTMTGRRASGGDLSSADYWTRQIRSAVLFHPAVRTLEAEGANLFLEIGPSPTLVNLARRCVRGAGLHFFSSLRRGGEDRRLMLESLSGIYRAGGEVDWKNFYAPFPSPRGALPTYPFQRSKYWIAPLYDTAGRRGTSLSGDADAHPLIGEKVASPALAETLLYRTRFTGESPAFLKEHVIMGTILSPAMAHLSMAAVAAGKRAGTEACTVRGASFTAPLVVKEEEGVEVQMVVSGGEQGFAGFELFSRGAGGNPWVSHCRGEIGPLEEPPPPPENLETLSAACPESWPREEFFKVMHGSGYDIGPVFQRIREIRLGEGGALCRLQNLSPREQIASDTLHPGVLDSILQTLFPACRAGASAMMEGDNLLIPLHVGEMRVYGPLPEEFYAHARSRAGGGTLKGDIRVFDSEGRVLLELKDALLRQTDRATLYGALEAESLLHAVRWEEVKHPPAAAVSPGDGCLIFADEGGVGKRLEALVSPMGIPVTLVTAAAEGRIREEGGAIFLDPHDRQAMFDLVAEACGKKEGLTRVFYLWGLDTGPFQGDGLEGQRRSVEGLLHLVQALAACGTGGRRRLWSATRHCQAVDENDRVFSPFGASLTGLCRVMAREYPDLHCGVADLHHGADEETVSALAAIGLGETAEREIAVREKGALFVPRFGRLEKKAENAGDGLEVPPVAEGRAFHLAVGPGGAIDQIHFSVQETSPPAAGEVEIEILCADLNFRDLLNALGRYPGKAGRMGMECAGRVLQTGDGVTDLAAGDPVIGFSAEGCMGDRIVLPRAKVRRIPQGMGFQEAVMIPTTFLTAYYALHVLGEIRPKEKVLIHSAAGGVGMAAVQLAMAAGAEVFATAGSPAKRRLLRSLGVRHLYDSRSLSFVAGVREAAAGSGVDLVLNALVGEFIDKSLSLLSPGGRFIEMGKADMREPRQVAAVDPTLRYLPFDMVEVARESPALIRRMFDEVMAMFARKELRPLPRTVFAYEEAKSAFRFMAQAKHIGKVILSRERSLLREAIAERGPVRPDATYLITGGMGALGLRVAEAFAERGASALALVGRSGPGPAAQSRIQALEASGVRVACLRCDVADEGEVRRTLHELERTMPPLSGIVHAAGVLEDGMVENLTWEKFRKAWEPKVPGAWNLHLATSHLPLELFVAFSSISTVLGNPGQGNYAAGNAFLDALVHFRRGAGLPGISIDWGPWAAEGMAEARRIDAAARGVRPMDPAACIDLMADLIVRDKGQVIVADLDREALGRNLGAPLSAGMFSTFITGGRQAAKSAGKTSKTEDLSAMLAAVPPRQRAGRLLSHLTGMAREVLGYRDTERILPDKPLVDQGFDSLMAVDMRNRLNGSVGGKLPASLLFDYPTLEKIGAYLLDDVLHLEYGSEKKRSERSDAALPADSREKAGVSAEEVLTEIDSLLDDSC